MTKASQSLSVGLLVSAVYFAALYNIVPIFPEIIRFEILPVLPLWALVTLGAYLLSRVGWALLTFNDVPEAAESLKQEIEMARRELREKGVDVD